MIRCLDVDALHREHELYRRIADAMAFADPSELAYGLSPERTRWRSARDIGALWSAAVGAAPPNSAFNLYVHVPFCKSICSFCNYKRLRTSNPEALDEYVDFIVNEARILGERVSGVRFGSLYVGGGTPSVLSAARLQRLFEGLHASFRFHDGAAKTFEYDPMVMTDDRFDVLHAFAFSRYSFGVQSTNPNVNALHNRGQQSLKHVEKQFELLDRAGATHTNVDFLLGLAGTTPEQIVGELAELLERYRPHEVSAYFVSPTADYVAAHFDGDYGRFDAHLKAFEAHVPAALRKVAEERSYEVRADGRHSMLLRNLKPGPSPRPFTDFAYSDVPAQAERPLYLLGLGDSARSRIFGHAVYRAEHAFNSLAADAPRYLCADTSWSDEVFAYVAYHFRDADSLSPERFRSMFGAEITDICAGPLEKLVALDLIEISATDVRLRARTRKERMRDTLFFLPQDRLRTLVERSKKPVSAPAGGKPSSLLSGETYLRLLRPYVAGSLVTSGWSITSISASGAVLSSQEQQAEIVVRLFEPAGQRQAFRSTKRFDLQYFIGRGAPSAESLTPALLMLIAAIERNETTR